MGHGVQEAEETGGDGVLLCVAAVPARFSFEGSSFQHQLLLL